MPIYKLEIHLLLVSHQYFKISSIMTQWLISLPSLTPNLNFFISSKPPVSTNVKIAVASDTLKLNIRDAIYSGNRKVFRSRLEFLNLSVRYNRYNLFWLLLL